MCVCSSCSRTFWAEALDWRGAWGHALSPKAMHVVLSKQFLRAHCPSYVTAVRGLAKIFLGRFQAEAQAVGGLQALGRHACVHEGWGQAEAVWVFRRRSDRQSRPSGNCTTLSPKLRPQNIPGSSFCQPPNLACGFPSALPLSLLPCLPRFRPFILGWSPQFSQSTFQATA